MRTFKTRKKPVIYWLKAHVRTYANILLLLIYIRIYTVYIERKEKNVGIMRTLKKSIVKLDNYWVFSTHFSTHFM